MAEWSMAAVLKTVVLQGTGGSNPSSSAKWQQKTASSLLERGFLLALCIARRRREGCRRSRNPGGRGIPMSPSLLRSGPPGDTAASLRFAGIFAARFSPKNSLTLQERACWRLVGFFEGSPCAKQASLPPGPARCALSCAKSPSLPPGAARCGLPCAKRAFLPPGPAICGLPCANRASVPPGPAS